MRHAIWLFLLMLFLLPCPAPACSLCGTVGSRISLLQEFDNAQAALYGRLANPQFGAKPGTGTTEFHIDRVIKEHADLRDKKMILLSRALPILDPKDPPRYLMFFSSSRNKVEPYTGRQLASPAVLDFLIEFQRHRQDATQALLFAANHLDHADVNIAEEAFLMFARADDKLIAQLAKKLSPEPLRKLLRTPDLEPERLSMFAFLLGACGNADDADLLRSLLKKPAEQNFKSFEGILAGYITMRPKEGWELAEETLKSETNSFLLRYATLRTMRFYYNTNPAEHGPRVLQQLGAAVQHSDLADIAIQDLRRWKRWEHTKVILACYDKKSHQSPIVQNSILRYALACPQPEARALVDRTRRRDPELIRYLEEDLMTDAGK